MLNLNTALRSTLLAASVAGAAVAQPAVAEGLPIGVGSYISHKLMKEVTPLEKPLHVKVCIFDILGRSGPVYGIAKDLALEAKKWNLNLELLAYTSEQVAAESFKTGECEAAAMTTLRAKQFNHFMGSLDSVGSVPSYKHMKTALQLLMGSEKLYDKSIEGKYQVLGMAPLGAAYVMVNDRSISSIEKAAGKKVAVMDWDKSQSRMIQSLGAQAIPSDITNFSNKFNNGIVDIVAAPAVAIGPMELYRGMGKKGGIFSLPLINVTGTILLDRSRIEKEVPDLDEKLMALRKFGLRYMDEAFAAIERVESQVPTKYWMNVSDDESVRYHEMMRQARIRLTSEGIYDPEMMSLLKKVRCFHSPEAAECSISSEQVALGKQ